MKKTWKNALRVLLIVLSISMLALGAVACSDNKPNDGEDQKETVTLNVSSKTIERFEDFTLVPTQSGSGELEWSSSDATVASVDGGKVMALKAGSTVITARVKSSPESKAECGVTVTDSSLVPTLSFDDLTDSSLSLLSEDSFELDPVLTYNQKNYSDASYTFTSSAPLVAAVSDSGVITAVAEGNADITVQASWRGCTASTLTVIIPVEVKIPVSEVDLKLTSPMDIDMSLSSLTFRLSDLEVDGTAPVGTIYEIIDETGEEDEKIGYDATSGALTVADLTIGDRVWDIYVANAGAKTMYRVSVSVVTKVISVAQDLANMYQLGGGLEGQAGADIGYAYSGYFVLAGNIDCTGISLHSFSIEWTGENVHFPEAGFHGTFDGRGYTISNLTVGDNGVFGILGKNSLIKNVAFINIASDGLEGDNATAGGHPGVLAERSYGESETVFAKVENVYISTSEEGVPFWSTIMEVGNYTLYDKIMLNAPNYVDENSNKWAGGGPLGQLVAAWSWCTARTSNCLFITNKENNGHQPEEGCPGLKDFHDGMTIYDPATYQENETFLATDFTEWFDCSEQGIWMIDSQSQTPVFKTSVANA